MAAPYDSSKYLTTQLRHNSKLHARTHWMSKTYFCVIQRLWSYEKAMHSAC